MELADTSAWTNRHKDPDVRSDFDTRVANGEIATCDLVRLELLWSARDEREFQTLRLDLEALTNVPIERPTWRRATDVFELLARVGPLHHRAVRIPHLIVAAAAELGRHRGLPLRRRLRPHRERDGSARPSDRSAWFPPVTRTD